MDIDDCLRGYNVKRKGKEYEITDDVMRVESKELVWTSNSAGPAEQL